MSRQVEDRAIKSPVARQVIYIVLAAALAVLTAFGLVTEDIADQIWDLAFQVAGILGLGLAAGNRPRPDFDDSAPPVTDQGV